MARQRIRVQLDLSPGEVRALDRLRDSCGLSSRADAVRAALAIIEWTHEESQKGRKIMSIGDDNVVPLFIPGITTSTSGEHE